MERRHPLSFVFQFLDSNHRQIYGSVLKIRMKKLELVTKTFRVDMVSQLHIRQEVAFSLSHTLKNSRETLKY